MFNIEVKDKRFIKLMIEKCYNANKIIQEEITGMDYLRQSVFDHSVNNSNVVYRNIGVLNISRKQSRKLQRMTNKVCVATARKSVNRIVDCGIMLK